MRVYSSVGVRTIKSGCGSNDGVRMNVGQAMGVTMAGLMKRV